MHADGCFRSDGDWFCAPGCTHDRDEACAERARVTAELEAAACAVADVWLRIMAALKQIEPWRRSMIFMPRQLCEPLEKLEETTRNNPLRKVRPEEAPKPAKHRPAKELTDAEIATELEALGKRWVERMKDDEGHGGSPGEGLFERMDELETEQKKRNA